MGDDRDDIQIYEEDDLYEINRNGFNTALRQFVDRYVDEKERLVSTYVCWSGYKEARSRKKDWIR